MRPSFLLHQSSWVLTILMLQVSWQLWACYTVNWITAIELCTTSLVHCDLQCKRMVQRTKGSTHSQQAWKYIVWGWRAGSCIDGLSNKTENRAWDWTMRRRCWYYIVLHWHLTQNVKEARWSTSLLSGSSRMNRTGQRTLWNPCYCQDQDSPTLSRESILLWRWTGDEGQPGAMQVHVRRNSSSRIIGVELTWVAVPRHECIPAITGMLPRVFEWYAGAQLLGALHVRAFKAIHQHSYYL